MTVTVTIYGKRARVTGLVWSSSDADLQRVLTRIEMGREPEMYDPDPDYSAAQYAVDTLKSGKIGRHTPTGNLPEGATW